MLASFIVEAKDGKLRPRNPKGWQSFVAALDGVVVITFKKRRRIRTDPQNRWYWGCVLALMEQTTGHTKEELHEAMKVRFNMRTVRVGSKIILIPDTTTELSTADFSAFCEKVRMFAATELNIVIPDPDIYYTEK